MFAAIDVAADYADALAASGEPVTLRRVQKRPAADIEAVVLGRVLSRSAPEDLVNATSVQDRVILVLAADLEAASFPLPIIKGDKILLRERQLTITAVDDDIRRIGEALIAYELTARG